MHINRSYIARIFVSLR